MKKGLVFGKFMPLHNGHLALIDYALQHCDRLYVILCYTANEPIEGLVRKQWLYQSVENNTNITFFSFQYNDKELPNTSVSSPYVSEIWANALRSLVPDATVVFTSEDYGDYLAKYMGIQHLLFDKVRTVTPISATSIRTNPLLYWNYIADAAKPWFVKKIAIVGSESTGKSVLTKLLATHFNTVYVPEMAREIIEKTDECTFDDLYKIADLHARTIQTQISIANKLLFVDTDLIITQSYSQFLFRKKLTVESWIEEANKFDLYLFMQTDCDYIQDGTRLSDKERNSLSDHHKICFQNASISLVSINGNWDERFQQAVNTIEQTFFTKKAATNE